MRTFLIILLLYTIQTEASPLHLHLDYLEPILFQEHYQSPNGHYKYGYESNSAIAHQDHDSGGTAKGFYSYVDDQGTVQHVEYKAGHDGYQVLGGNAVPVYTPEVEAARRAHMEAYLEAQRRALEEQMRTLEEQRTVVNDRIVEQEAKIGQAVQSAIRAQMEFILEAQRTVYNNVLNRIAQQASESLGGEINLFPGELTPIIPHTVESNIIHSTTARPLNDNVETKHYILPTPTVQHYEKIWPLPPVKFRDLAIEVNGQDRYDPRVQYNHWNNDHYFPQNAFPVTPSPLGTGRNIVHTPIVQKQVVSSPVPYHPKIDTTGLTAHQADLLKYKQTRSKDTPVENPNYSAQTNIINDPVTKIVVSKSHVDTAKGSSDEADVKKAFENALNQFKQRYNLS